MKSFRLSLAVSTLVLVLLLSFGVPHALAATMGTSVKVVEPPPIDKRILIKSVDVKAGTIEVKYMRDAKQPTHVYAIDAVTVLTVGNSAAKLDEVKVGMQVRSYVERDDKTLDSIDVSVADPPPVIPKKK
jgi:hypothetical protein